MDARDFRLNSPEMTKLLKDVYLPAFETETWNNAGALSEAFGQSGIGSKINATSGKLDVYFKKGTVGAVGAFGDDLTFDHSDVKNVGDEAVIRTRGFQANAGINIIASQRMAGPEAWENIFENQFEELTKNLKRQYARMLYGDGSGKITTVDGAVTAGAAGATVTVKVADIRPFKIGDIISFGPADAAIATLKENGAGVVYEATKQEVDSKNRWATHGNFTDTTKAELDKLTTVKIDDIDYSSSEIIVFAEDGVSAVKAIADKAVVYYRRSVNSDIHGLDYIIRNTKSHETGTTTKKPQTGYFGLGETVYGSADGARPRYLNSHITSVENFLTEDAFMKHYEEVEMIGGEQPDLCVTSRGTRRAIASVNQGATTGLLRLTRAANASASSDVRSMGYAGVDLKGQSIEVDRFAPSGKLWMLNVATFDMANEKELTFDDFDGLMWKQTINYGAAPAAGKTAKATRELSYEANMYAYRELFNKNPRNNGYIEIKTPQIITPDFSKSAKADIAELGKEQAAGKVA